jgi:parallel beta helix pectate lyase-like protein
LSGLASGLDSGGTAGKLSREGILPMRLCIALVCLLPPWLAASVLAQSYATTVHVDTVTELQNEVLSVESSTEILIADGTYHLTQTLMIDNGVHDIALRGESGNRNAVIIAGPGMSNPQYGNTPHGIMIRNAQDVLVADLTVRDFYYHNVMAQGEQGAERPTVRNVRSIDAGEQHIKVTLGSNGLTCDGGVVADCLIEYTTTARSDYTNGVDVLAGADWVVRDCTFRNIRAPVDGGLAGPTVLFWRGASGTLVERNRFFNCERGVALGLTQYSPNDHVGGIVRNNFFHRAADETGDVGIAVADCPDFEISHNTVILSGTFFWNIEYRFEDSVGVVAGNITDGPIQERDGVATPEHNLTMATSDWFVDMGAGDLHLTESATPALDGAQPRASVTDDIDGEPRSLIATDIGADERIVAPELDALGVLHR